MNKKRLILISVLSSLMLVAMVIPSVIAGEAETTIVGVVNADFNIETADGRIFKVAESEMGVELLEHVGEKFEVMGRVTEKEGKKIIRVTAFTPVEE